MVQEGPRLFIPRQAALPYAGTGTVHTAAQQGDTCVVRTYWRDTNGKKRTSSDDDVMLFWIFTLCVRVFVCLCLQVHKSYFTALSNYTT
jgi:hypothetical protein